MSTLGAHPRGGAATATVLSGRGQGENSRPHAPDVARRYEVLGDKKTRADYDDGVDVDAPLRGR